jgi:hypothetical protein
LILALCSPRYEKDVTFGIAYDVSLSGSFYCPQ